MEFPRALKWMIFESKGHWQSINNVGKYIYILTVSSTHLVIIKPDKTPPGHIEQILHYRKLPRTRRERILTIRFLPCVYNIKDRNGT